MQNVSNSAESAKGYQKMNNKEFVTIVGVLIILGFSVVGLIVGTSIGFYQQTRSNQAYEAQDSIKSVVPSVIKVTTDKEVLILNSDPIDQAVKDGGLKVWNK